MGPGKVILMVFSCILVALEPGNAQGFQRFVSPGGPVTSASTRPPNTTTLSTAAPVRINSTASTPAIAQPLTNSTTLPTVTPVRINPPAPTPAVAQPLNNSTNVSSAPINRTEMQPVAVDVNARLATGSANAIGRLAGEQTSMRIRFSSESRDTPMSQRKLMTTSPDQQRSVVQAPLFQNGKIVDVNSLMPNQGPVTQNGESVLIFIGEKMVIIEGEIFEKVDGKINIDGLMFLVCNVTIALEEDFTCCISEVYPKDIGDFLCCDNNIFFPDTEICCQNLFYPKVKDGSDRQCCGLFYYKVNSEFCCQGSSYMQGDTPIFSCCENSVINIEETACCENSLAPRVQGGTCCGNIQIPPTLQCCDGRAVPGTEGSCCGGITINPVNAICCDNVPRPRTGCGCYDFNLYGCCNGQTILRELALPGSECCGRALFLPATEVCCSNGPFPKSQLPCGCLPNGFICCGGNAFNRDTYICCNNQPFLRSTGLRCCNRVLYNPNQQVCCGNRLILRSQTECGCFLPSRFQCCAGAPFNPAQERCCNRRVIPRSASPCGCIVPAGSVCCGGVTLPAFSGFQCCGRRIFHIADGVCCNDVVFLRSTAPCSCLSGGASCDVNRCGSSLFNPSIQLCCDGVVRPRDTDKVCCGNLLVHKNRLGCCRGIPFLRSIACCHPTKGILILHRDCQSGSYVPSSSLQPVSDKRKHF